ncbi:unnamed protein product [Linum trigynum]|uniref:SBP-type domain-containing protein n=1 Tax=Linum trigynum TaxID=586398 RepID=A0AAV2DG65_9ROSI
MDIGGSGGNTFPSHHSVSSFSPPNSSSSSSVTSAAESNSINGLQFGQKIYFGDHVGLLSTSPPAARPPSGAAARKGPQPPPPPPQQQIIPRCQVEGCSLDLSDAKPYYSRHKVCGTHSKTPTVIVAGLQQRFCQQCSRFHQLSEFDQGKRSCRRRLAGHNERRRKPPSGSLLSSRYGRLSSSLFDDGGSGRGGFLLDFSAFPRSPGREAWPPSGRSSETAAGRSVPHLWQQNPPPNVYHGGTGFPGSGECYNNTGVGSIVDSSCALSLLSNQQQWSSRSSASSSSHAISGSNLVVDVEGAPITTPPGGTTPPYHNTWGFKGGSDGGVSSSHGMMHSDLGLGHVPPPSGTSTQLSSELDMSLFSRRQFMDMEEHSRPPYGSSDNQHINWSL